jgi:NAD/NADP transhydrogenase alpha subunit
VFKNLAVEEGRIGKFPSIVIDVAVVVLGVGNVELAVVGLVFKEAGVTVVVIVVVAVSSSPCQNS